jgi:isopentenyl-diphosphate delta-isomerase
MALDATGHPVSKIAQRKLEHLRLSLEASVQSTRSAGFERFAFSHEALPELDLDAIDLTTTFLGKPLKLPFLISSMTGGAHAAGDINRRLALVAQSVGIAFGVGSQRAGITHKDLRATYQVRGVAPDVLLFANLGAVQLNYGMRKEQCLEAIEMIGADALVLHLNPLQEALQPEGDHNFNGLIEKIATLCRELPVPVIVKEVGCGISGRTAGLLAGAGVAAIDVAGLGGTSFARVEAFRRERPEEVELALAFSEWGIPTADALVATHRAAPHLPLIASGGLKHGLDAAKALGLGADLTGFAHAVLAAASEGEESVRRLLDGFAWQLRVAMFCAGAPTVSALKTTPPVEVR